jgi:hypothetical protein
MAANADRGRASVIAALPGLKTLKDARPNSLLLQMFQDCKLDETVAILSKATAQEKEEEYRLFYNLFPAATSRFENLKK